MTSIWKPDAKLSLDQLRTAHPGYEITDDRRINPARYTATAKDKSARLYCLITSDLAELAAQLERDGRTRASESGS